MDHQSGLIFKTAQIVGITAAAFLAGSGISYSVLAIPTILIAPPTLLLRQWRILYDTKVAFAPPIALLAALNTGYVAYTQYRRNSTDVKSSFRADLDAGSGRPGRRGWKVTALSMMLTLPIIPFTASVIQSISDYLMAEAETVRGLGKGLMAEEQVRELVTRLGWWNGVRSMLPLIGAVVGLFDAME